MGDEHSELKKRLWIRLGALALIGSCIGDYITHRHAFHDQGFKAFRWDEVLVPAFGVIMVFWLLLVGQRKRTTTLGIGEATTKKLQ
jgi:hypothetical protein